MIWFVFLAGIFNAIMDVLSNGFYERSVFSTFNAQWWDATKSYPNKHNWWPAIPRCLMTTVFVPFTDARHFFKMLMLFCLCLAICSYKAEYGILLDAAIRYVVFIFTFELFYTYLLRKV